jgi:His-Xaa-Ser system protein HxsD
MGEAAGIASEGLPADLVTLDLGPQSRSVGLRVDAAAHPVAAVYGAAFLFLDRCWVLLDKPDAGHVRVTLTPRTAKAIDLEALAGEFAEELVSSTFRAAIAADTRSMINAAIARAHGGGDAPPSLDELSSYEFSKEAMEDPLGLAVSWEEKHKPEKPEGAEKAETQESQATQTTQESNEKKEV